MVFDTILFNIRPNKKICVVPVTYPEKIRVGRSDLIDLIFYFIF